MNTLSNNVNIAGSPSETTSAVVVVSTTAMAGVVLTLVIAFGAIIVCVFSSKRKGRLFKAVSASSGDQETQPPSYEEFVATCTHGQDKSLPPPSYQETVN